MRAAPAQLAVCLFFLVFWKLAGHSTSVILGIPAATALISFRQQRQWDPLAQEHQAVPFVSTAPIWTRKQARQRAIWLLDATEVHPHPG